METTQEVLLALRRIIRTMDRYSKHLMSRYGMTTPQISVLRELERRDGRGVVEVGRALLLSQATVTGILNRLEARGLIERRRAQDDKRRILAWLTPQGKAVLRDAPPLLSESFNERFGSLTDWEQTQLLSSLQRVAAMMEAHSVVVGVKLAGSSQARSSGQGEPGGTPPGVNRTPTGPKGREKNSQTRTEAAQRGKESRHVEPRPSTDMDRAGERDTLGS